MTGSSLASNGQPTPSQLLDFLETIGKLKKLERTGWVRMKIKRPESVADHMYRMSVMSAVIQDDSIDLKHCALMSLAHDMGESIVGDITPHDGVSDEDKFSREERAMRHIRDQELGGSSFGHLFYDLWREYEAQETKEAQLVRQFDKFEMIVQAYEYERDQQLPSGYLQQFFDSTVRKEGTFTHPQIKALVNELLKRRESLATSGN
eukprot:Clim_evm30s144 gene=Clim_evmTU30s144